MHMSKAKSASGKRNQGLGITQRLKEEKIKE